MNLLINEIYFLLKDIPWLCIILFLLLTLAEREAAFSAESDHRRQKGMRNSFAELHYLLLALRRKEVLQSNSLKFYSLCKSPTAGRSDRARKDSE